MVCCSHHWPPGRLAWFICLLIHTLSLGACISYALVVLTLVLDISVSAPAMQYLVFTCCSLPLPMPAGMYRVLFSTQESYPSKWFGHPNLGTSESLQCQVLHNPAMVTRLKHGDQAYLDLADTTPIILSAGKACIWSSALSIDGSWVSGWVTYSPKESTPWWAFDGADSKGMRGFGRFHYRSRLKIWLAGMWLSACIMVVFYYIFRPYGLFPYATAPDRPLLRGILFI